MKRLLVVILGLGLLGCGSAKDAQTPQAAVSTQTAKAVSEIIPPLAVTPSVAVTPLSNDVDVFFDVSGGTPPYQVHFPPSYDLGHVSFTGTRGYYVHGSLPGAITVIISDADGATTTLVVDVQY